MNVERDCKLIRDENFSVSTRFRTIIWVEAEVGIVTADSNGYIVPVTD
jgi:hypothetical protein